MRDSDAMIRHYEEIREEDRLTTGMGQLELVRTREVVHRFLGSPPAQILDVGGGPGIHAAWLADEGFDVHVVDLSSRHVSKVLDDLSGAGVTAEVGDATSLSHADGSFDVVLLLGPLYHLTEREDRLQALREAATRRTTRWPRFRCWDQSVCIVVRRPCSRIPVRSGIQRDRRPGPAGRSTQKPEQQVSLVHHRVLSPTGRAA